jgi:hypothetical protein
MGTSYQRMFRWTSFYNHEIVKHYDGKELLSQ